MSIEAREITKKFGSFTALDAVSLRVEVGELVALLGPSGSGKTTLLRIIAGLEFPDAGSVFFDDQETTERSAQDRGVGFVFQHYALFRHMSVYDNVAFGLTVKPRRERLPGAKIKARVMELLKLVQLDWLASHYPSQLSGGQRQRVALARALAVEPRVLLLDEPFGALDAKVRQELRRWLRRLHDEIHVTSIFVTHDQEEALEVADRVAVMNAGRIEQEGSPDVVYHQPANAFVYNFLGNFNLFHARVEDGKAYLGEPADGRLTPSNGDRLAYVRPHLMNIERQPQHPNPLSVRVKHINSAGPLVKVELATERGDQIHVEMSHERYQELGLAPHDNVYVSPRDMKVF
ncbi:MAG TPA: sulfate ABC transporter ATP-binding protein [Terriglobia bacterium]|nr:sulfate ABC transporter ATP-binding protein [Terriglobia bacterium]